MNPQKKQKIKELLGRLKELESKSGGTLSASQKEMSDMLKGVVNEEMSATRKELQDRPVLKALDKVSKDFAQLKKDMDMKGLFKAIEDADTENSGRLQELEAVFAEKIDTIFNEVRMSEERGSQMTASEIKNVLDQLSAHTSTYQNERDSLVNKGSLIEAEVSRLAQELAVVQRKLGTPKKDDGTQRTLTQNIEDTKKARKVAEEAKEAVDDLRRRVNSRMASLSHGGGNANRNIAIGGNTSVLSTYTDINIKPGNNVSFTYTNNPDTKYLDLTITATGSGSGITREINSVAVDTAAGSTAGIDYVYLVSGTTTITLPTAVGNENLYTIKNVGVGTVTIATTGAETIDGASTIVMPVQYTSVDLISNNADWQVT